MNRWSVYVVFLWHKDHGTCPPKHWWHCARAVERKAKGRWLFTQHIEISNFPPIGKRK